MRVRKAIVLMASGVVTMMALTVAASASTGSGFTGTPQVRGTLPSNVHLKADGVKFQTSGAVDVVAQTITYVPGGYSGWHTHPGVVLVVVESGSVTLQVGCSIHTYTAGQSFTESGLTPIMARNLTTSNFIVRVTYVVPKGVLVRREVALENAPKCDQEQDEHQKQQH